MQTLNSRPVQGSLRQRSINRAFTSLMVLALAWISVTWASPVNAQGNGFSLTSGEAIRGGKFSVFLEARSDVPITGFQVGIDFPTNAMELKEVSLHDTHLGRKKIKTFDAFLTNDQKLIVQVEQDYTYPEETALPPNQRLRLVRLDFKLGLGFDFDPNSIFDIRLVNDAGDPQVPALMYNEDQDVVPEILSDATIAVVEENFIKVQNADALRVGSTASVEIAGYNVDPLQGFSMAIGFDPTSLGVLDVHLEGTITDATGAEYLAPIIDNENGTVSLGVQLDTLPPFDNQQIPVVGFEVPLLIMDVEVLAVDPSALGTEIKFLAGVGQPEIRNTFVVSNLSFPPRTQSGRLSFIHEDAFLRGDVNDDGMVDMSDSVAMLIWVVLSGEPPACQKTGDVDDSGLVNMNDILHLLFYLFRGGEIVAPPFPNVDVDPTPDELFCHS